MDKTLEIAIYLVAACLMIIGLKGLTHPRTAVRGNLLAAVGMLIAVLTTVISLDFGSEYRVMKFLAIAIGMIVGGGAGWIFAVRVAMTEMPQLVALFNGLGGAASAVVAALAVGSLGEHTPAMVAIATGASGLIGAVTLTGSFIAFAKLQGIKWVPDKALPGGQMVNLALVGLSAVLWIWLSCAPDAHWTFWLLLPASLVLGVSLVVPIGGADMPVVISLLNSYSGLAAAATGFIIMNPLLIVAGSLVGASGIVLTSIMCKAMNRSLANVAFGGMGTEAQSSSNDDDFYATGVKSTSPEEVAMMLDGAQRVVVVPGYGMAVAQAQHAVRDLYNLLEAQGTTVEFAIHPVAGRMPGHMNVLLAEADIPYEKLKEMDEANTQFEQTDVTIIIGANDVVNPVARTDPKSPIAGMPILDVDKSRTVVVIKRSLSPGFAGIPNPLFIADNSLMLFDDAKKAVLGMVAAIKEG